MVFSFVKGVRLLTVLGLLLSPFHTIIAQTNAPLPQEYRDFLTQAGFEVPANPNYSSVASDTLVPRVLVQNMTATVTDDNHISGSFAIHNESATAVGDIRYEIQVLGLAPSPEPGKIIADTAPVFDRALQPGAVALAAGATTSVPFTYQAPALPEGLYRLRIQLTTSNDRELGWETVPITLRGAVSFVTLTPLAVVAPGIDGFTKEERTTWGPLEGVNIAAGQPLTLQTQAKNIGPAAIKGTVQFSMRRLLSTNTQPTVIVGEAIEFAAGSEQTIAVPIQAANVSGAYQVIVTLITPEASRVANLAEFRYVVRGVSASVVSAGFNELRTKQGETAVIAFTIVGPADRETNVKGSVEVSLLEGSEVAGSTNKNVELNGQATEGSARVQLTRDVTKPGIRIVIRDEAGTVLDTYEAALPDIPATTTTPAATRPYVLASLVGLIILLVVSIALLYWWWRRRHTPPPASGTVVGTTVALVILLAGVAVSFLPSTQASGIQFRHYWWHSGWGTPSTSLFVNRPIHQSSVASGSVLYEARLWWVACTNSFNIGTLAVQTPTSPTQTVFNSITESQPGWRQLARYGESRYHYEPTGGVGFNFLANLDLSGVSPGTPTTLRTWSESQAYYRRGWSRGIVTDFTHITIGQPTPPPPPPINPPAACLAPDQGYEYDITVATGYNNVGSPPPGTGWSVADQVCLISNISLQCERNSVLWQRVATSGRGYIVNNCANPGNGSVKKSQTSVAASWSPYAPSFCLWEKTGGASLDLKLGHAGTDIDIEMNCNTTPSGPHASVYKPSSDYSFFSRACIARGFASQNCASDICLFGKNTTNFCPAAAQCSDTVDNDSDGRIDSADPGCHTDGKANNPASYDPNDNTEADNIPQCRDGIDNDNDGKIDAADAGCHTDANAANAASYDPNDLDEVNTHCSDGKDNDGDGKIDQNDPGCRTKPSDPTTYNPSKGSELDPGVSPGPIQETE